MLAHGWDRPETVSAYEAFCRRHARYRRANRELARRAALAPGLALLDLMAGTGRTTEALLPALGPHGHVTCVEPAAAMRARGITRVSDTRAHWHDAIPARARFDRIVCGAGIWQLEPFAEGLASLVGHLSAGGALVFNVPAAYLGEPDPPGGGRDPYLTQLLAGLAGDAAPVQAPWTPLPHANVLEEQLRALSLKPQRWSFRLRLTQRALRDWLKIPVLTDAMWPDLPPRERARRIDRAFQDADPDSWRCERWIGWTAWR